MIHNSKKLVIYTDGGARGNPGPAAIGIVIYDSRGKLLKKFAKYLGERTNNEAEYEAVIQGLLFARNLKTQIAEFKLDSELIARQLNYIYRVREKRMLEFVLRIRNLETNFKKVSYRYVPREKNAVADRLVNECLDDKAPRRPGK